MEFGILGPLEVVDEGRPIPIPGQRQRSLLALLLVHANEVLSGDRLIEELWGSSTTRSGRNGLQAVVSRLRRALNGHGALVATRGAGYVLAVEGGQVDVHGFERLLADGRAALARGDPGEGSQRLREALALWRGDALVDFLYEPFAQAEIARLEELRLGALEARVDADLGLGRHEVVVAELERLVLAHPLRERFCVQRMLGLYRCGRQAEALEAYRDARRAAAQLGLEPSVSLRELELAILRRDPDLDGPPSADRGVRVPAVGGTRKPVSVLHVVFGVVDRAGRPVDPEAARGPVERALAVARIVIERHGGIVDDAIGSALAGVFGLPTLHESDAMRALRAAEELRTRIARHNLEWAMGLEIEVRIGLHSEEIVPGGTHVAAAAVTTAAGLAHRADAGEVVLTESLRRLVPDAVRVEPCAGTWRLAALVPGATAFRRRLNAPLLGRSDELAAVERAFSRVEAGGQASRVVVVGAAGIGKTRLALEVAHALRERATVVTGHCPEYGERITYAPLREIVTRHAGGLSPKVLRGMLATEPRAADVLWTALGNGQSPASREEIRWATRRFLEIAARQRPLVVVIDDLHCAEPTFIDLLEHLSASGGGPVLLLCSARPELLEQRPAWAKEALELEPLSHEHATQLLGSLGVEDARTRERLLDAAEGNPLFLEQMAAMRADGADVMPPTLEALLAARLERLRPAERAIMQAAAIVGREFSEAAVAALLVPPARASVRRHLETLTAKQIVRAGWQFHHGLVRLVAYRSITKAERAGLHERFANWLGSGSGGPLADPDAIIGFHLEQACRYRRELGLGAPSDDLAQEAVDRLVAAAARAYGHYAMAACADLRARAVALLDDSDARVARLQAELGQALLWTGDYVRAETVLNDAVTSAQRHCDAAAEARARLALTAVHAVLVGSRPDVLESAALRALEVFERVGEERDLAEAYWWLARARYHTGRYRDAAAALRRSAYHARKGRDWDAEDQALLRLTTTAVFGATPIASARKELDEILAVATDRHPGSHAVALEAHAMLLAFEGRFAEARPLAARGVDYFAERGTDLWIAWSRHFQCWIEIVAKNFETAERMLRPGCALFERLGAPIGLLVHRGLLAHALHGQGRDAEALSIALDAERLAPPGDRYAVLAVSARATALAGLGHSRESVGVARLAVEALGSPELLFERACALLNLTEVLERAGDPDGARAAAAEAGALAQRKGATILADRALVGTHASG